MSKHNQYYRDTDFRPEHSAGHTLLVQLGNATFSYAVIGENKLIAFEEGLDFKELSAPSEGNELLAADYKERIIGLPQTGFTLMPVSLFKPDLTADISRFLDVKTNEKVFSQSLDNENRVIFKVDESLVTLTDQFEVKSIVFCAKGWITAIAKSDPAKETIYLNIGNDKVELLNFKDGKLRFYNSFEFKNADELVYYTAFVAEELQLQQHDATLVLGGDVEEGDKNSSRLANFFRKVELNDLKPVDIPAQISPCTILSLTALSLCGSSAAH